MTYRFSATMRRMNRAMRPAKAGKATRSLQKAMEGFIVKTALAPLGLTKLGMAKPRKAASSKAASSKAASSKAASSKAGIQPDGTIKRLRVTRSLVPVGAARETARGISPRIPDGAQFLSRKHRSASGSRNYKIYLSASHPRRPKGLILMLHGCSQSPDDFAAGTHMNAIAEKHGLAIVYPAQTEGHNGASCWNWFKTGNQGRGIGEPAILASLTQRLMREFGLGRESVFVAGLSAGGAMAAILADVYPDVFSAAGIHSGLARGAAHNAISAMSVMRKGGARQGIASPLPPGTPPVRRIVFQGDADGTVHPSNASTIVAAAVGGDAAPKRIGKRTVRGRGYVRSDFAGPDGAVLLEYWMIKGLGHAWSGGRAAGSFTDRKGPDASIQMIRFFLANSGKI